MSHLVLLGDSILDNRAYVAGGRAVIDHLRSALPPGWQATLLAIDGSTVASVARQLTQLPLDATHLVLSVGGNDALLASGVLLEPAASVGAALARLAAIQATFETAYATMLQQVLAQHLPTIVCTIYYPHMAEPNAQLVMKTGLLPFNDTILRRAARAHLPLLDLRAVCTTPADYANEIEPSDSGGAKIAQHLLAIAQTHSFEHGHTSTHKHCAHYVALRAVLLERPPAHDKALQLLGEIIVVEAQGLKRHSSDTSAIGCDRAAAGIAPHTGAGAGATLPAAVHALPVTLCGARYGLSPNVWPR